MRTTKQACGTVVCALAVIVTATASVSKGAELTGPFPDVARFEPGVRQALNDGLAALKNAREAGDTKTMSEAWGTLGMLYQAHHLKDASEYCFGRATELAPDDFRWAYYHAFVLQEAGRHDEAIREYRRAVTIESDYLPALLRLGRVYMDSNKYAEAGAVWQRVLDDHGPHAAALTGLGRIAMREERYQQAVRYFVEALRLDPSADQVYYPLAMAYRALHQIEPAKAALARRGSREPQIADPLLRRLSGLSRSSQFYLELGYQASAQGRHVAARNAFAKAVDAAPDDVAARVSLGQALFLTGDVRAAAREFDTALELEPDHAVAHYRKGVLLWRQGDRDTAERHFLDSASADPAYVPPRLYLANRAMARGELAAAANHYGVIRAEDSDNVAARYRLALLQLALNDCDDARESLDEARVLNPRSGEVIQALIRLYSTCGTNGPQETAWAIEYAAILYESRPGTDHLITLAMATALDGRYEEATRLLDTLQESEGEANEFVSRLRTRFSNGQTADRALARNDPLLTPPRLD